LQFNGFKISFLAKQPMLAEKYAIRIIILYSILQRAHPKVWFIKAVKKLDNKEFS